MIKQSSSIANKYKIEFLTKAVPLDAAKTVHIGISMSNPRHQGKKLETLLTWASERYSNVQVNLHDTLQHHNIRAIKDCSEQEAYGHSIELGHAWIRANKGIILSHSNITLRRREEILADFSNFPNRLQELLDLYLKNSNFRQMIDSESQAFIQRKKSRDGTLTENEQQKILIHSRDYILDELALMSLLNEKHDFVEIYAGRFLNFLKDPKRHDIKDLPEGLKNYPMIEVDFVRQKQLNPKELKVA